MNSFVINTDLENSKSFPCYFCSLSDEYEQESIIYAPGIPFHQILFVLEGEGILKYNGGEYVLKPGTAFFIEKGKSLEYINKKGLITAFITAIGISVDFLCKRFSDNGFYFCDNTDTKEHILRIRKIIDLYRMGENAAVISAMTYDFFARFLSLRSTEENTWYDRAKSYINQNYSARITLDDIAHSANVSVSKLCHEFKKEAGTSVVDYINDLRLKHAHNMLCFVPGIQIKEVASSCGIADVSYFTRLYRKKYGITPSKVQKNTWSAK